MNLTQAVRGNHNVSSALTSLPDQAAAKLTAGRWLKTSFLLFFFFFLN